jgi:inorganic phosphate transporter, PiT family
MSGDIILVIVVGTALAFDFTNGVHDTANVVATSISTRAIGPRRAVAIASLLNFVGAFISFQGAATVGKGFVDTGAVTTTVVFAGLVGAIAWNVITWYSGLPSSSSNALIGGLLRRPVRWPHARSCCPSRSSSTACFSSLTRCSNRIPLWGSAGHPGHP